MCPFSQSTCVCVSMRDRVRASLVRNVIMNFCQVKINVQYLSKGLLILRYAVVKMYSNENMYRIDLHNGV